MSECQLITTENWKKKKKFSERIKWFYVSDDYHESEQIYLVNNLSVV